MSRVSSLHHSAALYHRIDRSDVVSSPFSLNGKTQQNDDDASSTRHDSLREIKLDVACPNENFYEDMHFCARDTPPDPGTPLLEEVKLKTKLRSHALIVI